MNNLPEPFKKLFIQALKDAAEGKTPSPFNVPPAILVKAGFKTDSELSEGSDSELEPEPEPEPGEAIPVKSLTDLVKTRRSSREKKSFVDLLADKIADKILERLTE